LLALARMRRGPATVGSMVLAVYTGVQPFAKPGADTSRYTAALYFVNALSRLFAPLLTAQLSLHHVPNRTILLIGGTCVIASSFCYFAGGRMPGWRGRWSEGNGMGHVTLPQHEESCKRVRT
jgi:hypothetical protein